MRDADEKVVLGIGCYCIIPCFVSETSEKSQLKFFRIKQRGVGEPVTLGDVDFDSYHFAIQFETLASIDRFLGEVKKLRTDVAEMIANGAEDKNESC